MQPTPTANPQQSKFWAEIRFRLTDLEVAISSARLRTQVIPEIGNARSRFADEETDLGGLKFAKPDAWRGDKSASPSSAQERFDAGAQHHEAFQQTRKVEATAAIQFANMEALLRYLESPKHGFIVEGEYKFPKFSLAKFNRPEYSNITPMLEEIAEGFATLVVSTTRSLNDLPPEKKPFFIEAIKQQTLGRLVIERL